MHSSLYILRIDLQPDVGDSVPKPLRFIPLEIPGERENSDFSVAAITVISHSLRWVAPQRCLFNYVFIIRLFFRDNAFTRFIFHNLIQTRCLG